MFSKKRFFKALAVFTAACTLGLTAGCKNEGETASEIAVGGDVGLLRGVELDYENAFFDDFTGGVSYGDWYINKQAWGNGNGGVIPENVNYTDDGVLVLSGNGEYYTEGDVRGVGAVKDGRLTGAALTSKFVTGPGRYRIKMKVLPRLGACSAFWTYCYDKETGGNHEIDIELPGGKSSSMITFENVLNTNYITESMNNSQDMSVTTAEGEKIALNDGEWHTFGFDWYTMEEGEDPALLGEDANMGKVVYYVDGKITAISDFFVPYYQARLWIGVWFPNNTSFVGDAEFASDCMYVDWVEYVPFKDQPCVQYSPQLSESQVATASEYPTSPVATTSVNKIANGDFEYVRRGAENSGYITMLDGISASDKKILKDRFRAEISEQRPGLSEEELEKAVDEAYDEYYDLPVTEFYEISADIGYQGSCGARISDFAYLRQVIDSVYSGFETNVSFRAKGKGKLVLSFMEAGKKNRKDALEQVVIDVDGDEWSLYEASYVAPQGTKEVWVDFVAGLDNELYVDNVSLKLF